MRHWLPFLLAVCVTCATLVAPAESLPASTIGSATPQSASGLDYDANDRLHFVSGSPDSYDKNGNARYQAGYISQSTPGQVVPSTAYPDEYDLENRLVRRRDGSTEVTLVYDADGNRVRKKVTAGGSTTAVWYLVDDRNPTGYAQVLEERDGSGNLLVTHVYGLDLVSQTRNTGSAGSPVWTTRYYGYDGQGTVRYLTDGSYDSSQLQGPDFGKMTDVYTYDAFGILTAQLPGATGNQTPNSYRYTGEQWDEHLGMYYLRAAKSHKFPTRYSAVGFGATAKGSKPKKPAILAW